MRKSVLLILLIAFGVAASNAQTDMSGKELLEMLHSIGKLDRAGDYTRAVDYISGIYSKHFNNGVTPKINTQLHLANVVDAYMSTLDKELDVPAEALVVEAINSAPALIDAQKQFWANAYKAAEAYFAQPSPPNAEKFCTALPEKRIPILDLNGERRLQDLVFDVSAPVLRPFDPPPPGLGKNFFTIERGMDQGDPYAVDIMFRLFNISDGAMTETICFVLGEFIPKHPRLFLQKYSIHEGKQNRDLGCTLGMVTELGEIPEAGDDPVKFKKIYDERIVRRIKALESVDDPDLREIRDRCLARLKEEKLLWP